MPVSAYLCPKPSTPLDRCNSGVRPMQPGEKFGLSDAERGLFDCIASEHVQIIGTTIEYFPQNQQLSQVDALYNEPIRRSFSGPFMLSAYISYPEHSPSTSVEGFTSFFDATAFITRTEFERVNLVTGPGESDVLRIWNTPYWNQTSVDGFNVPGAGLYFSIVDVREDGVLFDTPSFMGFTLTIRRVTQQTPERKITNSL